jgi:hypothetical protein
MWKITVLWLGSLVVVAAMASAFASAQARQAQPQATPPGMIISILDDRIISGSDLGFRVEGTGRAGEPTGRLVVRINGNWVETGPSKVQVQPLR